MTKEKKLAAIKEGIGAYPDFPKKGVIFRDIFPLLRQPHLFEDVLNLLQSYVQETTTDIQGVAGIEARGFLFGPILALRLGVPFLPIRKPGKLPGNTRKEYYSLEYGSDCLELQTEAVKPGLKVVIVDDLIATGGSMQAAVKLIQNSGGIVSSCLVVMELNELNGRTNVSAPVFSLVQF